MAASWLSAPESARPLSPAASRMRRLRSKSGADNVSFEGIQCRGRKVKRYGYGSAGNMVAAGRSEWRFIKKSRQDSYRNLLADAYCPPPMGNVRQGIINKLKNGE